MLSVGDDQIDLINGARLQPQARLLCARNSMSVEELVLYWSSSKGRSGKVAEYESSSAREKGGGSVSTRPESIHKKLLQQEERNHADLESVEDEECMLKARERIHLWSLFFIPRLLGWSDVQAQAPTTASPFAARSLLDSLISTYEWLDRSR